MTRVDRYRVINVTEMPRQKEDGVVYVSKKHRVAVHLCACGCGNKSVTPLNRSQWTISISAGDPTLWPSIGNWGFPCRSHYIISNGQVRWSSAWSRDEVHLGAQHDRDDRDHYFAKRKRLLGLRPLLDRIARALRW